MVSGDEAAGNPDVRALAEDAKRVVVLTMFHELAAGWADLILPATAGLERDGTSMNLEGRVQRIRRAVFPPCPDELAWISKLAERFDVDVPAHAMGVFAELAEHAFRDLSLDDLGAHAPLPARHAYAAPAPATTPASVDVAGPGLRLHRYRPLFSGPAVERVPELAFQRPERDVELSPGDAESRGIANGDPVLLRSNGTSVELRARINRKLVEGVARVAEEHAATSTPRSRWSIMNARLRLGFAGEPFSPRVPPSSRERGEPPGSPHPSPLKGRGAWPMSTQPVDWWVSLIEAFIVINLVMATFAYLTLAERKVMARMQLRYGPNRAGFRGLLQPIADLLKLLNKESFQPREAIDWAFILGPFLAAFTALTTFSVIPFGPGWEVGGVYIPGQVADLDIALVLIFAVGSIGVYGFILGGWSSDSKFALLGSMRTCAQLVSYEVALALSVLGIVIMAGTLSLTEIVSAQADTLWYAVPQFVGLVVFLLAGTAETARAPFDLPEAEQELVAGYHTEYGGMRFGLYSMSEYINLITLSALCVTLFLGGWHGPGWDGASWAGPLWFIGKLVLILFVFIWMRTTLPRLRYDQLMRFGWKVLLPVATINAVVTAILVVAF